MELFSLLLGFVKDRNTVVYEVGIKFNIGVLSEIKILKYKFNFKNVIMKKTILFLFAVALLGFTACNKDKETEQAPAESSFEFKIEQTNFFKGSDNDVPECSGLNMDYVVFDLGGTTYTTDLYTVNGEILTEVIKLPIGNYQLTSFLAYNNNGTPNDLTDDVLVKASPAPNSEYWDLMDNKLNLDIVVEAFYKKQIEVDVLCFEDLYYESFGFTWFELNDIKIERQCFFGDICTGCYVDFEGSLYEQQPEGVQMDMPAIFQVKVFKEGENDPIRVFDNTEWLGVGSCLEVYWPNNLNEEENFTFELWVLLPSGDSFDYQLITVWDVQDEFGPDAGNDGVVDFVIGSCQYQNSDYNFPYWMNLPEDEFTMVTGNSVPGSNGTYFDVTFSGLGDGYYLANGTFGVYCGDHSNSINLNTTYTNVTAYNSLSTNLPANFPLTSDETVFVNYFFNNIGDYIDGWDYENPTNWELVQNVIWGITDADTFTPTGEALTILNDVLVNGAGYVVPPGGYAGIILWDTGSNPAIQMLFTVIDPC